jgi:hypothetical protein
MTDENKKQIKLHLFSMILLIFNLYSTVRLTRLYDLNDSSSFFTIQLSDNNLMTQSSIQDKKKRQKKTK